LGSSATSISAAAASRLGELLTGTDAKQIADRLADGDTLSTALRPVASGRRPILRDLLAGTDPESVIAVLRAIQSARAVPTAVRPVWTMPGHLAHGGPLTSSIRHLVDGARQSVVCSTYNFQRSSSLWDALSLAARRPELTLRLYIDAMAANSPSATEIATRLKPGVVLRTKEFDGRHVRNHAKFLAIDHRFLLVSSANFSWSAENDNLEFGVIVDDRNLTEAVEREMRDAEEVLYDPILGA
jgi:phosphatidylserine/phosphatidylglycerophosphate/cardiolipin synthase-like enzyme